MKKCTVDDCVRPHRARGLCATHYNQAHQPGRHRKVTVPCSWCGKGCEKEPGRATRYARLYCSMACRDAWRCSPRETAKRRVTRAAAGTRGQVWVAGDCHSCGTGFVGQGVSARYCSMACSRREQNRRKEARSRAKRKGVHRTPYSPVDIYRRDAWQCHLCRHAVRRDVHYLHPLSPTIDHLIPISAGGDDAPHNVRCAHRSCNSKRGVGGVVQLLLVG